MVDTTVISEKFGATYKQRQEGDLDFEDGFIGTDSDSGGYPYFSDKPARNHLHDKLVDAMKDVQLIETGMRTYYGNEGVDFGSVRVVRYKVVIESIEDIEQAQKDALINSATGKLTEEELIALTDNILKHTSKQAD